jgi:hypothetical protein
VVTVHLAAGRCTQNRHLQLLGLLVDEGRWQQHQLRRLGLHGRAVIMGSVTQGRNTLVWKKKDRATRYQASGGQQARERATGTCISPYRQNIGHVTGEVDKGRACRSWAATGSSTHVSVVEQVASILGFVAVVGQQGCGALGGDDMAWVSMGPHGWQQVAAQGDVGRRRRPRRLQDGEGREVPGGGGRDAPWCRTPLMRHECDGFSSLLRCCWLGAALFPPGGVADVLGLA